VDFDLDLDLNLDVDLDLDLVTDVNLEILDTFSTASSLLR